MAIKGLTITSQTETVVDFTHRFWVESSVVVLKYSTEDLFYLFRWVSFRVLI